MHEAANDDGALVDADVVVARRFAAASAKAILTAQHYAGVPNLLDLATATCMEIRRENAELHAAAMRDYKSEAERSAARRWVRPILARINALQDDLAAMTQAMDSGTLAKLDEAIDALPSPAELVAKG